MILKLYTTRPRGLVLLIARMARMEDLPVCVQSDLSVLAAATGGVGVLDCIEEGQVKALMANDPDLADLLQRAIEAIEKPIHGHVSRT